MQNISIMTNLVVYCASAYNLKVLDKLPSYIKPIGLGGANFPNHWLTEKVGENISKLNKFYGEHSAIYWVWKNKLNEMNDSDWIGFCHYRKLWLNNLYKKKQKNTFSNLYSNLLKPNNSIFKNSDVVLIQPIMLKKDTVFEQFDKVHKNNILRDCVDLLGSNEREEFQKYLGGKTLYPLNLFITKKYIFEKYCEDVFPWLKKCLEYCRDRNLTTGYNIRIPSFLSERYMSFWFSKYKKKNFLSYARLGSFMLSNNVNSFINPIKIPFTFRMYPTLHDY